MPQHLPSSVFLHRDGTSQAGRFQPALDPGYVSVDERSVKDLLTFARAYAKELRYFDAQNREDGDWSAFLGPEMDLEELAAFMDDPNTFTPEQARPFSRPHVVLFLVFLELLQHARTQLNDLTRRHLEFTFRDVFRLTPKAAVPDRVHALIEPAEGQEAFLLRAGTLLQAGQDSQRVDRFYRIDQDIVANRAQVASLKSLFLEKEVIGIREAHQQPNKLIDLSLACSSALKILGDHNRAFMAMLAMALGEPGPGGKLPIYPANRTLNITLLSNLDALLRFIQTDLYMSLPGFRSLMQWKRKRLDADDREWKQVNDILEQAGKKRKSDFVLDRAEPQNFQKNLLATLGRKNFAHFFDGLPEVENIYDLYRRREREDVQNFIQEDLHLSLDNFNTMMGIIDGIHKDWRGICYMLRAAGRKKQREHPGHTLKPPNLWDYEADRFDTLIRKTLETIDFSKPKALKDLKVNSLDDCYNEVLKIEAYFHMSAEDFALIREIHAKEKVREWEWDQVYGILEKAHNEKVLAERRMTLQKKRESEDFDVMVWFALRDPKPGDDRPGSRAFMDLDPVADQAYIREKLCLEIENFKYIKNVKNAASSRRVPDEAWQKVYAMLERAKHRKRGWEESGAQIEKWGNIYAAEDAAAVRAGGQEERETPRWKTFGRGSRPEEDAPPVPAEIGFAVASPLLALAEGKRKITLTLGFSDDAFDQNAIETKLEETNPLRFFLSTEKGMVEVIDAEKIGENKKHVTVACGPFNGPGDGEVYTHALQITLRLGEQAPPVAPPAADTGIRTPWPVLKILLRDIQEKNGVTKRYEVFQSLRLEKVHLAVEVSGIKALTLQNDDGPLNAKKPFEPFGLTPAAGSRFYIAHPEICSKKLDKLGMEIDWLGVPDDLGTYYQGYEAHGDPSQDPGKTPASPIADNTSFKAKLHLHDNRALFEMAEIQVFHANEKKKNSGAAQTHRIILGREAIQKAYPAYQRTISAVGGEEVLDWSRYWQIELLDPDFQHAVYPALAAKKSLEMAAACAKDPQSADAGKYQVNPPYTPKVKSLILDYTSSVNIDFKGYDQGELKDRIFHIHPFGCCEVHPEAASWNCPILPQYDNEGELYIGIRGLAPPRNLSLLFQLAEGSADPEVKRETIRWDYLSGNQWKTLAEGNLLCDTTNGLLNSGIITFELPPVEPSTLLPADLYWIRAAIPRHGNSVCDTVAIHAQAVSATFDDRGNAPDHLDQPLPAESITGLADPRPGVRAVLQPYTSFGGKGRERASRFHTRVSERLRHKNRALTSWDYERMILEAFPGIYKAKCLPVDTSEDPRMADYIRIIVIPDIRGKQPFDPFEPKMPADMLLAIEQFLLWQSAPFARFKVQNPTYVRLKVRFGVRFRQGYDPGYYREALNGELQRFLAPWAYDHSAEIVFGGKINASLIVNFVEKHPCVDYLAGIKLFTSLDGVHWEPYGTPEKAEQEEAFPVAPDAILVSARQHEIDLITGEAYEEKYFSGINYMKIELDFKVAAT